MTDTPKPGLVKAEPAQLATTGDPFVDFLWRAARDESIDVDKLERIMAMKERADAVERERIYADAMAALQAELKQISKRGLMTGTSRKYARLEDIDEYVRPMLAEHGFSVSYDSEETAKGTRYTCKMRHRAGFAETKSLILPIDTGAGRNAVQSVGSTTSYARRYLLEMHLNLVKRDEDDDGAGGSPPITTEQAAQLRTAFGEGDPARFFRVFGCDAWEGILARDFERARRFIEEKRRGAK